VSAAATGGERTGETEQNDLLAGEQRLGRHGAGGGALKQSTSCQVSQKKRMKTQRPNKNSKHDRN
jgi:hypothetical protein